MIQMHVYVTSTISSIYTLLYEQTDSVVLYSYKCARNKDSDDNIYNWFWG